MKIRTNIIPIIAAILSVAAMTDAAAQSADDAALVTRGQRVFLRCQACHDVGDTSAKIGPSLKGVMGRKVASVAGYAYSPSLASQSFVWDDAQMSRWLEQPSAVAAGTSMAFIGLPSADDRRAVIAYLKAQR